MTLSEKLKYLREQKGESLQAVADSVGSSKTHIHALENPIVSANPTFKFLCRLSIHFNVDLNYFSPNDPGESLIENHLRRVSAIELILGELENELKDIKEVIQ